MDGCLILFYSILDGLVGLNLIKVVEIMDGCLAGKRIRKDSRRDLRNDLLSCTRLGDLGARPTQ